MAHSALESHSMSSRGIGNPVPSPRASAIITCRQHMELTQFLASIWAVHPPASGSRSHEVAKPELQSSSKT